LRTRSRIFVAIIILTLSMGLVAPERGLGIAQGDPTELYPVTISLGTVERVFFANHVDGLADGNWIELSDGIPITLPSLNFIYDGVNSASYTIGGTTITIKSTFTQRQVTYPLETHHVYEAGENVDSTFWGSTNLGGKSVSFMLLNLPSLLKIKDALNDGVWETLVSIFDSLEWIQTFKLSSAGDKTYSFDAPETAGDYILVVGKIDLIKLQFHVYSATALEVVDYPLDVSVAPSVVQGNNLGVSATLESTNSESYIYGFAMIEESEYSGDIELLTDGTISGTKFNLNDKEMADGALALEFFLGTKDQSYLTIDLIEDLLTEAFDSTKFTFDYTTASTTGTTALSTSTLTPGNYILLVGVWKDWNSRIVGLKQTTVTVTEYKPPPVNKKPVAKAGPDQTAYVGETVSFSGADSYDPDGTIVSYKWDFGDGDKASGIDVQHAYSEADSYTVTLTVKDNKGAKDTDTCVVTVTEVPPDTGTLSIDTEPVKGEVFVDTVSWGIAPVDGLVEAGTHIITS